MLTLRKYTLALVVGIGTLFCSNSFAGSSGTVITATKTANAEWTRKDTYQWSISKTTTPNQVPYVIPQSQSQTVSFTITATRSGPTSTSWSTPVSGEICVSNTGTSSTSGLYITDQLENAADSSAIGSPIVIPVTAELAAGQSQCYPYQFNLELDPNLQYKNHAILSIDNYQGYEGTEHKIDAFAVVTPHVTTVSIDGSATITDTFSCPAGFTCTPATFQQTVSETTSIPYTVTLVNQSAACGQTLTPINTAVLVTSDLQIQSTASESVTIYTGSCPPPHYQTGDYCTYSQGGWGANPNGGNVAGILAAHFSTVYPSGVSVGIAGSAGYSMTFTSSVAINTYLPANSTAGILNADLTDPTTSSSGVFGGQALAMQLNNDFNNAGYINGTQGSPNQLILQNTGTSLDGLTMTQILGIVNTALGGGAMPSGFTPATLSQLTANLVLSFDGCTPSDWAQSHLLRAPSIIK